MFATLTSLSHRLKAGKGMVSLITRLPVPGLYKLEVTGVHKGQLRVLGQFCLRCTAVTEAPKPFPSNPENGFGFDETSEEAGISNPSQTEGVMLVDKGQTIDFSFEVGCCSLLFFCSFLIQTHKRFGITLFIRTKHNMRIFGVIPFIKLKKRHINTTVKRR